MIEKQRRFEKIGRDTVIKFDDPRIREKLSRDGHTFETILWKDELVYLLDNANLSTGGDSIDVTDSIHESYCDMAIRLTRDMGLRFCGVDIMVDGLIQNPAKIWWVIEINAAPGIDNYASAGKEQQKIVEDLYLEVLKAMSK